MIRKNARRVPTLALMQPCVEIREVRSLLDDAGPDAAHHRGCAAEADGRPDHRQASGADAGLKCPMAGWRKIGLAGNRRLSIRLRLDDVSITFL